MIPMGVLSEGGGLWLLNSAPSSDCLFSIVLIFIRRAIDGHLEHHHTSFLHLCYFLKVFSGEEEVVNVNLFLPAGMNPGLISIRAVEICGSGLRTMCCIRFSFISLYFAGCVAMHSKQVDFIHCVIWVFVGLSHLNGCIYVCTHKNNITTAAWLYTVASLLAYLVWGWYIWL